MKASGGEGWAWEIWLHGFLTSALEWDGWSGHTLVSYSNNCPPSPIRRKQKQQDALIGKNIKTFPLTNLTYWGGGGRGGGEGGGGLKKK